MKYLPIVLFPLMLSQVPPDTVGLRHALDWECVTTDVNGDPETVGGYVVGIFAPGEDVSLIQTTVPDLPCEYALRTLILQIPAGEYELHVKCVDKAGNESAWSEGLLVRIDAVPPAAPPRPGCKLLGG